MTNFTVGILLRKAQADPPRGGQRYSPDVHSMPALVGRTTLIVGAAAVLLGILGPLGPFGEGVVKKSLPSSGSGAAKKLPKALAEAAAKHGVQVRATLFSAQLEELYGYNLEGVPTMMALIARDKARAVLSGYELKDPSLLATGFGYMLPWMFGMTKMMPVMGSVRVKLPGMDEPGVFVVNGAPVASTDLRVAEEALAACGMKKDASTGVWGL